MAEAIRDGNYVPNMLMESSTTPGLTLNVKGDELTGRLLVDNPTASAGYQQPTSGVVNGVNKVFVWAVAPNVIVVDQTRVMQATNSSPDLNVNWTGTTTTTLQIAPTFDIFASA